MGKQLHVVVLSRHDLTRKGLTHLIEVDEGRAYVVRADGVDEDLSRCDAVIYDLAGRDGEADDDLRRLVATGVAVIVLRADSGQDVSERLLAMGVADVVSMSVTSEALVESLESAAAGRRVSPAARRGDARAAVCRETGLSERQIAVLELIATGLTNDQIAASLYVSINTVKTYVRTTYKRIGADSRSQAVIWAMHQGLGRQADGEPPADAPDVAGSAAL
jgi:DNA-binding NarL/FixJ family response regulator